MFILLQFSTYGWVGTLKVMRHSNGHIIRLAGDVHVELMSRNEKFQQAIEHEQDFLRAMEEPLMSFLYTDFYGAECVVEGKIIADLSILAHSLHNILLQDQTVLVSLITRLNILVYPRISNLIKSKS